MFTIRTHCVSHCVLHCGASCYFHQGRGATIGKVRIFHRTFKTIPVSQFNPVHPSEQVQLYDPSTFEQVAPFWQGELSHSFMSVAIKVLLVLIW